jgi:periplasmic copper chaperone A
MRRLILLLTVLGLVAAGCGGDEGISIDGQWARNSPMSAERGAVYMNITSADGDRLLSASVDPSIAATTEVHETVPAEGESGDDGMAMMMMQQVDAIDLPAGETISLKPGGYHIMLIDIAKPLEIGQKFTVTLNLEKAGEQVVEVEVREEAPTG